MNYRLILIRLFVLLKQCTTLSVRSKPTSQRGDHFVCLEIQWRKIEGQQKKRRSQNPPIIYVNSLPDELFDYSLAATMLSTFDVQTQDEIPFAQSLSVHSRNQPQNHHYPHLFPFLCPISGANILQINDLEEREGNEG